MSDPLRAANPKAVACGHCQSANAFSVALHVEGNPPFWTIVCTKCKDAPVIALTSATTSDVMDTYNATKQPLN